MINKAAYTDELYLFKRYNGIPFKERCVGPHHTRIRMVKRDNWDPWLSTIWQEKLPYRIVFMPLERNLNGDTIGVWFDKSMEHVYVGYDGDYWPDLNLFTPETVFELDIKEPSIKNIIINILESIDFIDRPLLTRELVITAIHDKHNKGLEQVKDRGWKKL